MPPILAKDKKSDINPTPEGLHQAICCDVVDLGLVKTSYQGTVSERQMVRLFWQVEEKDPKTGKRYTPMLQCTNSLNEKANLRKFLEAWRGKPFSTQELEEGFDLEKLIGVNCQLQIAHNIAGNGRTYANVQAIVPLAKGMVKMQVEDYIRFIDRKAEDQEAAGQAQANVPYDDDVPF